MISVTKDEFKKFSTYITNNYGINLKEEKIALLTARLQNVLIDKGYNSFSEYYDYILSDKTGQAAAALVDRISTNHTYFMREAKHFGYFANIVLPYLKEAVNDKDIRIWSAGCSTG